MSLMDEESVLTTQSPNRKKLVKRGKSPGGSENEQSPVRNRSKSISQQVSREASRERVVECNDLEDDMTPGPDVQDFWRMKGPDESELDLAMRLELAKRNSVNQHVRRKPVPVMDQPVEETIYEGG